MSANYIKRPAYIDKIKPFIGKQIIKVLTGQRRVGRSYILLQLIDEIRAMHPDSNIIYINIEYSENESLRTHTALYQYVSERLKENVPNFLLVDEVQEVQ